MTRIMTRHWRPPKQFRTLEKRREWFEILNMHLLSDFLGQAIMLIATSNGKDGGHGWVIVKNANYDPHLNLGVTWKGGRLHAHKPIRCIYDQVILLHFQIGPLRW